MMRIKYDMPGPAFQAGVVAERFPAIEICASGGMVLKLRLCVFPPFSTAAHPLKRLTAKAKRQTTTQ